MTEYEVTAIYKASKRIEATDAKDAMEIFFHKIKIDDLALQDIDVKEMNRK